MNVDSKAILIGAAVIVVAAIAYFSLAGSDRPSQTPDVPQTQQKQ